MQKKHLLLKLFKTKLIDFFAKYHSKEMKIEINFNTKEEAITAVTTRGAELQFCSPELQNDEEVVMEAIKQDSLAFQYASAKLKSSKAFIMNALNESVHPFCLIKYVDISLQSDFEIMALALEKSNNGWEFEDAKGEAALDKELAAKALVKWCAEWGASDLGLWHKLNPTLQEFFTKDCWYKKAQSYLYQLEQEKQAKMVSGGCTTEDGVVW